MGEWPPTRTCPVGSRAAVLWYVRGSPDDSSGVHVLAVGSYFSAWVTGKLVPGSTTSSRLPPLKAMTWPVGSRTPVENQRALLRAPVATELNFSVPPAVLTVLRMLDALAR